MSLFAGKYEGKSGKRGLRLRGNRFPGGTRSALNRGTTLPGGRKLLLLLFILLLGMVLTFRAGQVPISPQPAQQAARCFVEHSPYFNRSRGNAPYRILSLQPLQIPREDGGDTLGYVVQLQPEGFLILTAREEMVPILAYSDESPFVDDARVENIFPEMVRWDLQLRQRALRAGQAPAELLQQYRRFWQALLSQQALSPRDSLKLFGSDVWYGPFLTSSAATSRQDSIYFFPTPTWGQGYVNGAMVFNIYTPNHWPAGCVATAMAEILAYYRWPPRGTGSHSYYEDDAGWLSANFGETWYDWANTLDNYYNVFTTGAQKAAAGLLTYHCGIAVDMNYEANGSSSNVNRIPNALHNYFRHSGHYMSASSTFFTQLRNNMMDARPAALAISSPSGNPGHAVVADGYAEGNGYFHLNMGWNGNNNNWYDITGTFYAVGYGDAVVDGGAKGIVPNPMICDTLHMLSTTSFILSWNVSHRLHAQYYELQQRRPGGNWVTLNAAIPDTFYTITVSDLGTYYFRVRARRDNIWWDWSETKTVQLGTERHVTFRINMSNRPLQADETLVLLGNIPPLGNIQNSPTFTGPDSNGVYQATVDFDYDHVGDTLLYRYGVVSSSGVQLEDSNRVYVISPDEYQTLPVVWFNVFTGMAPTGRTAVLTENLHLYPAYPNPFNSSTVVEWTQTRRQPVQIRLLNILGQEVAVLLPPTYYSAGRHRLRIHFRQQKFSAGIYFLQIQSGRTTRVQRLLYLP